MGKENVLVFKEFAEKNPELMEKLKAVKSAEEIIALAAENGFSIEESDLTPAAEGEVSLDELDSVAGGIGDCEDFGENMCDGFAAIASW